MIVDLAPRRLARALPLIAPWPALLVLASACTPLARPHDDAGTTTAIRYALQAVPPASGGPLTRVRLDIDGHGGSAFVVRMPVWTPGEYRIQRHGRSVRNLRLVPPEAGRVEALEDGGWTVKPEGQATVHLEYELPNTPAGVFTENVDVRLRSAFYDGAATFLYVEGRTREPVSLSITPIAGWRGPLCTLDGNGNGPYRAATYEELVDSPVLLGERVERSFEISGKPHTVAFFGSHRGTDYDALAGDFRQIVRAALTYMGSLPYRRYVLYLDMNGRGGGLEHGSSARIALPSGTPRSVAARFMAHEFFHLWNVKRIRPAVLGPFDYGKAARTRSLWFCEGVTEYVAGLLTLRAGLMSEDEYLGSAAVSLQTYVGMRGRRSVTPETASWRIWEEGWSTGFGGVSVYTAGEVIGLCLDLRLLYVTAGRAGLQDVMLDLMARHAPPRAGYDEDGIREAVVRVGGAEMGPFYDRLVRTTQDPPLNECLGYVGLRIVRSSGSWTLERDEHASASANALQNVWLNGRLPARTHSQGYAEPPAGMPVLRSLRWDSASLQPALPNAGYRSCNGPLG